MESKDARAADAEAIEALSRFWDAFVEGDTIPSADPDLTRTVDVLYQLALVPGPTAHRIWTGAQAMTNPRPEPVPIKTGRRTVGLLPGGQPLPLKLLAAAAMLLAFLGGLLSHWPEALHAPFQLSTASAEAATPTMFAPVGTEPSASPVFVIRDETSLATRASSMHGMVTPDRTATETAATPTPTLAR